MTRAKNPIERRLDVLAAHWDEFVQQPEARILRWRVATDEARMLETFLALHEHGGGEGPDFLMRLTASFEDPQRHGFTLIQALRARYEEERGDLEAAGIAAGWSPPSGSADPLDVRAFVRCCASFHAYYGHLASTFGVALLPERISSPDAWSGWLQGLAAQEIAPSVRFMVIDSHVSPELDALEAAHPGRVISIQPDLDMAGALSEIARDVPGDHPGNEFRRYFVALGQAAEARDRPRAEEAARRALALATDHEWFQMQVVIQIALGGVRLALEDAPEALDAYRAAVHSATLAVGKGDVAGPKLLLNALLAEGGCLFASERHSEAARVYERAALQAIEQRDPLMTLESWRMAASCHHAAQLPGESLRCGLAGLDAAEELPAQMQGASTLPFLGDCLLRVAKEIPGADERQIRARIERIAGKDWERSLEGMTS